MYLLMDIKTVRPYRKFDEVHTKFSNESRPTWPHLVRQSEIAILAAQTMNHVRRSARAVATVAASPPVPAKMNVICGERTSSRSPPPMYEMAEATPMPP